MSAKVKCFVALFLIAQIVSSHGSAIAGGDSENYENDLISAAELSEMVDYLHQSGDFIFQSKGKYLEKMLASLEMETTPLGLEVERNVVGCKVCKIIMKIIQKVGKHGHVKEVVGMECNHLGPVMAKICRNIVSHYLDILINHVSDHGCKFVHLC